MRQIPWLHGDKAVGSLPLVHRGRGDEVRLAYNGSEDPAKRWMLAEIPDVQGALIAMSPHTGAIEALANGFTAATIVSDALVVYHDRNLDPSWRPQNYSGKIFGPTRLREGLVHSRNLESIRVRR